MINRRTFIKYSGLAIASAWFGPIACSGPNGVALSGGYKERPNVLLITLDDQNDWCGCLGGHPNAKTPNIDRLASQGMLFTNAHSSATFCEPSRSSMFTGLRPSTTGIYYAEKLRDMVPKAVTLPQHFMAHGYYSLGTGKLFNEDDPDPSSWHSYWPSKRVSLPGRILPPKDELPLNGFPESKVQSNLQTNRLDWGPLDIDEEYTEDGKDVAWLCHQLFQKHGRPFFFSCGLTKPRKPYYLPRKYFDMHPLESISLPVIKENDLEDIPERGQSWCKNEDYTLVLKYDKLREATRAYLASSSFADAMVGRILDALEKSSYASNTIVILLSDHGFSLGPKLRIGTASLWEEVTRIPLVIFAPGITRQGTQCVQPASSLDIYPTLIQLCDLSSPRRTLDGESLLPLLQDPKTKRKSPAVSTNLKGNHAARSERWRYIRYKDGHEELYDHDHDPHEWFNVAKDPEYGNIKKELASWLPG